MDIETGSVLANRGLNGYGWGHQGNFMGDGSAVNANVTANRDLGVLNAISENTRDQFLGNQIDRGHTAITDNINTSNQFLSDRIWSQGIDSKFAQVTAQFATLERNGLAASASAERLAYANQSATIAQLHAMDLKQTECCCELKAGQAAILAKLDADRATAAETENQSLKLQIAINNQGRQGNS